MMKAAKIESGVVVDVFVASSEVATERGWIPCDDAVGIGWTYADGVFSAPVGEVPLPPVPAQISIRQFLLQLAASGIITSQEALTSAISRQPPPAIDAIFEGLPPSDALAARITWASMVTIPRNDPLFALAGPVIYPTDTEAQIDDFFRAAGAIS